MSYMIISIIVPVYNGEKHIERCIKSICDNTYLQLEIIIVDDGSTDDTPNICKRLCKKDKRIMYYKIPNSGVSVARNIGLTKASGKYIMFIDSDDAIEGDYFESYLNKSNNEDFIMGGYSEYDIVTKKIINKYENMDTEGDIQYFCTNIQSWITPPYLLSPWGKMYKKEIIDSGKIDFPTNINYGEDVIFVLSYLMQSRSFKTVENAGYIYTIGENNNLSSKFNENMIDYDVKGISIMKELLQKNLCEDYQEICDSRIINCFSLFSQRLMKSKNSYSKKKNIFYEKSQAYFILDALKRKRHKNFVEQLICVAIKHPFLFNTLLVLKIM